MPITLHSPAAHPGAVVIKTTDRLAFELKTDSPAPIFSFKVDAALVWDAKSAKRETVGKKNIFTWDHPDSPFGHNQIHATDIAVIIIQNETYDYTITKVQSDGSKTLVLQETFAGPEPLLRDTLAVGIA